MSKKTTKLPFVLIADLSKSKTVDLKQWKSEALPIGRIRIEEANHSGNNWKFEIRENQLLVIQKPPRPKPHEVLPFSDDFMSKNQWRFLGRCAVQKVANGHLVGLDHGEFGGGLLFVSNDEREFYQLDDEFRVKAFFEINSKLYALEGLCHFLTRRGQIIEIYQEDLWTYKSVIELTQTPNVIYKIHKNDDHYLIITERSLVRLTENLAIEHILDSPFSWHVLYLPDINVC
jgi:hypothetical protein